MKKYKYFIVLFALAGLIASIYLTNLHFIGAEGSFCNLSEYISCDVVNQSMFSEIIGIPISVLGIFFFLFMLLIPFKKTPIFGIVPDRAVFYIALFMTPLAIYFTIVSITVIGAICIVCEFTKVMMLLLAFTTYINLRAKGERVRSQVISTFIILGIIASGIAFFIQTRSMTKSEYNTFAQCVYEKGFRMYGSATCAFCARQRALFGESFQYIKEIECDPRNQHAEAERCIAKNIAHTPTWIVEDKDGNTVRRFDAGVLALAKLSTESGCELIKDE